jgi:hypothetical protein
MYVKDRGKGGAEGRRQDGSCYPCHPFQLTGETCVLIIRARRSGATPTGGILVWAFWMH